MKVLFVREKWAAANPNLGPSDSDGMVGCLASTGLGQAICFYYDEWMAANSGQKPDAALMALFSAQRPDLAVVSPLLSLGDRNVSKSVYGAMRANGAKVLGAWFEGVASDVVKAADEYADCVDFNLFVDTTDQFLLHTRFPEKCFGLLDPRCETVWKPLVDERRNIGVSFLGTLICRPQRLAGYVALMLNGIPVMKLGGRLEEFIAQEQYIGILQRSAITINFADAGKYRHYKGRVAEATLCGALLMEQENPETPKVLREYMDFVPFSNEKDLFDKTVYYLGHNEERRAIAKSGHERALEKLNGREFWMAVFEKVGLV